MSFVFNTKELSKGKAYNLNDPVGKREYFDDKALEQVEFIRNYLDTNTFLSIAVSKKMAGKGTYIKMFAEIIGEKRVHHVSIGDVVRETQLILTDPIRQQQKDELVTYLQKNYRGYVPLNKALDSIKNKTQSTLMPNELVLLLAKKRLENIKTGAIFLDGFPRNLDQISYSLFLRDLMRFSGGTDFFMVIDVPEELIKVRILNRRICPKCHTSRNLVTHPSKFVDLKDNGEVFYRCDNPSCSGYQISVLIKKEGDDLGLEPIRKRLDTEQEVIDKIWKLHGVEHVYIPSCVPVSALKNGLIEKYELTPEAKFIKKGGKVVLVPKPLIINNGSQEMYSTLPPAAVLSMVYQIHSILSNGYNHYVKDSTKS